MILLAVFLFALFPGVGKVTAQDTPISMTALPQAAKLGKPMEMSLTSAGSTTLDLRNIVRQEPRRRIRPELDPPPLNPVELPGGLIPDADPLSTPVPGPSAPAPSPIANFAGLDFSTWGAGWPPDTVGDVGPTHYIQSVNTALGIYNKSTGVQITAFTLDAFFSLGNYGNLCDTDNFGDPVILYDSFEDRWVISDFAFQLDGSGNVVNPPGAFECIAVSKTGDPVTGGWNFYFLNFTSGLNDYPKLGIWPDGIYMSANMFGFSTGLFQGVLVWALNKKQMYAGDGSVQVVQFEAPPGDFSLLPANARLQTGTPPAGSPNYFSTIWQFTNSISFYKFHVDWDSISLSTFTGPFISIAPASWGVPPTTVSVLEGANVDTLQIRLMMQNQYSNIGGVESLWNSHTVLGGAPNTAAPRYYQVEVTGGAVAGNTTQAATHTPDTTVDRYMPSLAVDRAGDMAIGYSASSSSLFPAIRYAGRLSSDAANTLPQTETSLIEGSGAQTSISRWGDYTAMSLDPDGCTFWYTNEYFIETGTDWQTRIGSFKFPDCATVSSGTVQGTVTATTGGAVIEGAIVSLGSRTTTTDGSGFYQFTAIPSGTYPELDVAAPGFDPDSSNTVVVSDSSTTIRDFALDTAPVSACPIDTSQADFQFGVPAGVDLVTSAGDVTLEFLSGGFVSSGNLISSLKDSNPAAGGSPTWSTLSWNGSAPADTILRFQAAGSNSASGPFNYVGPDGSAGTFYTSSGGSLSQFDGNRYLRYQALLSTTDSGATPTLNDVTVCYNNSAAVSADLSISKTDGVSEATPGGSVTYTIVASNAGPDTATGATVSDTFPGSLTCNWTCSGASGGGCAASGSGNISDNITLPVGGTATYTATCDIASDASGSLVNTATVSFAGDGNNSNNSATDTDSLGGIEIFADGFEDQSQ